MKRQICPHLEAELAKLYARRSVHATPVSWVEALRSVKQEKVTKRQLLEFRDKLLRYGLPNIYASVLVCHFGLGWSDADIAEELHIPSRKTVFSIRAKAILLLKERNFK